MTQSIAVRIALGLGGMMLVCGSASPLWANAGPSATPANVVAEPVGIEDVRIARETLSIDLRPVRTGSAALVQAVYFLQNEGPERELGLLFAFGTQKNSDCYVTLDDEPIAGVLKKTSMPRDWRPPKSTPALDGSQALKFGGGWNTVQPLSFSIVVPPGESVLAVRYRAGVTYTYARPAMYRQFAYVLAPAHERAGFGGLDVTIRLPEDWSVAATPALTRDGATMRGRFDELPADAIALTLRPPVAAGYRIVKYGGWSLCALLAIGGLVLCRRYGGGLIRSAAIGLAYGMTMLAAGIVAAWCPDRLYPPTAAEIALVNKVRLSDGYSALATSAGVVLLSIVAAFVGCVIAYGGRQPDQRKVTHNHVR